MTMSNGSPASMATPISSTSSSTMNENGPGSATATLSRKLHGRAFYESIGSPKFILAPMVDQSEFAWRMLTRSFMPKSSPQDLLAYSPMLHARMFMETTKFRDNHFQPHRTSLDSPPPFPDTATFLDGNPAIDRPLFVQFCANDPGALYEAARYVAPFCDAVDLNLGCPQGIARKGKYGAFLQEDQELIFNLINKLHKELDVPITAKIRILETREKTLEYAQNVLKAGASILTVHGRTRDMKGHKTGLADWSTIRWLREQLPKETVLFANGNILRKEDIDRCLEETGADGVMSAEGNLYDPAIFSDPLPVGEEGREYWRGKDGRGGWRMDAVFRRYMDILYKYVLELPIPDRKPLYLPSDPEEPVSMPIAEEKEEEEDGPPRKKQKKDNNHNTSHTNKRKEKSSSPNMLAMQPHLFKLLRPLVARHHHVRDALARCRAGDIAAFENVLQLVEVVVKDGLRDYAATDGQSWEEEMAKDERLKKLKEAEAAEASSQKQENKGADGPAEMDESSLETVKACKRPWWIVQPYVRPLAKEALAKGSLTLSKKEMAAKGERWKMHEKDITPKKKGEGKVEGEGESEPNGHVAVEVSGESREQLEIPKDGLVCG